MLVIFKKLNGIFRYCLGSTVKDLQASGWTDEDQAQAGDILVWEALQFKDGLKEHTGFSVGNSQAVSTSENAKVSVEHDGHFGETNCKVINSYRMANWDD
ncbi:hypothetical protein M1512_03935 [Patescibacteria group bacterium]|jgi:hypothetical protein|nr:hypothetical protein [Patescibacteria group bacterium]